MSEILRKTAHRIIDVLPEDKIVYLVEFLRGMEGLTIKNVEPDEFDLLLIEDLECDNEETEPLDKFAGNLGFNVNELRN